MSLRLKVIIKGAGELGSAVGWTLRRCGFDVLFTEIPKPLAVRRKVCFSEAVFEGEQVVEGIRGVLIKEPQEALGVWKRGEVAVLVDPSGSSVSVIKPEVLVDAIMAKRNTGTFMDQALLTIGLGPGFCAGKDVHVVIETQRGHNLGRVIYEGEAEPNTGIPGEIEGFTWQRVLRAPKEGLFKPLKDIGDFVKKGEIVALVDTEAVVAQIDGVIRGLLREGLMVPKNEKVGDIDPRGIRDYCFTISDKARAVAGGVLRAILERFNR
jgi:xanthine dehydrogenase accessory factor